MTEGSPDPTSDARAEPASSCIRQQSGQTLRMLAASEVTIGVSQSVLKDAFFKIFLAGPRSRSPRNM